MADVKCPIWGTPAERFNAPDGYSYRSPRAGGEYRTDYRDFRDVDPKLWDDAAKARLTTWIFDHNRNGIRFPLITQDVIDEVIAAKPMRLSRKIERFFVCLYEQNVQLETKIINKDNNDIFCIDNVDQYCEIKNLPELRLFRSLLKETNFFSDWGTLSTEGIKLLDKYTAENTNSNQVFVAMWFGGTTKIEEMNNIFEKGIKQGIESETGLEASRIKDVHYTGKIDDEIMAAIRKSKFIVADFTSDVVNNGGVYYEAGFAKGLDKEVIFTCHEDQIGNAHFDTRQINHILWKNVEDLNKQLNDRIKAMGLSHL